MVKLELNVSAIKKLALADYIKEGNYSSDDFEAYFYLSEAGDPIFVIEERT